MTDRNGERISGGTWFYKRLYPVLAGLFAAIWTTLVVVSIWSGLGSWAGGVALLCAPAFVIFCVYAEIQQAALLKDVDLGDGWLRISDSTTEITITLGAVETIAQAKVGNVRNRATVTLREPTIFGDRFTFMPKGAKRTPHFSVVFDDAVIVQLRRRVEAAQGDVAKPKSPGGPAQHSPMADNEMDGPL